LRGRSDELADPLRIVAVQVQQSLALRAFSLWTIVEPPGLPIGGSERAEERPPSEHHVVLPRRKWEALDAREAAHIEQTSKVGRWALGEAQGAGLRAQAVAANQQISLDSGAVLEVRLDACTLADSDQLVSECDARAALLEHFGKDGMQIAPANHGQRPAEHAGIRTAIDPSTPAPRTVRERELPTRMSPLRNVSGHTERLQDAHPIRGNSEESASSQRDGRPRLRDDDVPADSLQPSGKHRPADPCAYDQCLHAPYHSTYKYSSPVNPRDVTLHDCESFDHRPEPAGRAARRPERRQRRACGIAPARHATRC